MPGAVFLIWRQFSEVNFNMEAGSGGNLIIFIEAIFGGSFQYGGGFRGQFYSCRRISEAFVCLGSY